MLNKKGFTLVEMLFVISIILMMWLFTMSIHPLKINEKVILNDISLFINEAKTHAMFKKETVELVFNKNKVKAMSSTFNKTYTLNHGKFLSHTLSFNEFGHIINPKSVYVLFDKQDYQIVFQIGAGSFYVKS